MIVMAGLGFYWMHKAREAGWNPDLMRKNRDLATAELAVVRGGDVRVLSTNDAAGTMLVRDRKTGKTTLLKFDRATKRMAPVTEEANSGRVTTDTNSARAVGNQGDAGTFSSAGSGIPSWVPLYPGASPRTSASSNSNEKQGGSYSFSANDPPEKVVSYYSEQLSSAGMKLSTTSGREGTTVSAIHQDNGSRTVVVTISNGSDGTHVRVTYEESRSPAQATP
jgi:hypothetical protein